MRADHRPADPEPDRAAAVPRDRFDALLARVEALEGEVVALRAASRPPATPGPPPPHPAPSPPEGAPIGRRRALAGLAGAAAAGAAVLATTCEPAAAANDGPLLMGRTSNTASLATGLAVTGENRGYGIGVTDNGLNTYTQHSAILGHAKDSAFGYGVHALAEGAATALRADAAAGDGIVAHAGQARAGVFVNVSPDNPVIGVYNNSASTEAHAMEVSGHNQFILRPHTAVLPPASLGTAIAGSLRWIGTQTTGSLWACTTTGNPATWRQITGGDTAGAFHLLPTPVRVYDSRPGTTPSQGPKTRLPAGNVARSIDLMHNSSTVPAGAIGALVTVLLVDAASGSGNMTIWAEDKARPLSNTMVWGGATGRFTTLAMTALSPSALVKIAASLPTNIVLDVVGYYR